MCCFTQPVGFVSDTNIFARSHNDQQFLVYSMRYAAAVDLAMVLPLPVPPDSADDAVRFINLQRYPTFFDDMRRGFSPTFATATFSMDTLPLVALKLEVHNVGDFEASFVPRLDDFNRLDERFRIPVDVWGRLPIYRDCGFAVFKLKATSSRSMSGDLLKPFDGSDDDLHHVHPMAFNFPRRNPTLLYFPTVHVHDREVHSHAMFDHTLYCQADAGMHDYLQGWEQSSGPASEFMTIANTATIVNGDQPCWRLPLEGRLPNRDALVGKTGSLPSSGT